MPEEHTIKIELDRPTIQAIMEALAFRDTDHSDHAAIALGKAVLNSKPDIDLSSCDLYRCRPDICVDNGSGCILVVAKDTCAPLSCVNPESFVDEEDGCPCKWEEYPLKEFMDDFDNISSSAKPKCQFHPCSMTLGVGCGDKGSGDGGLFVHGDYKSIKQVQKMIIDLEKSRISSNDTLVIEILDTKKYERGFVKDWLEKELASMPGYGTKWKVSDAHR